MRYFEIILGELQQYKRQPNIQLSTMVLFCHDLLAAEDEPQIKIKQELVNLENCISKNCPIPLSVFEHIYIKNKHFRKTSLFISIKTPAGLKGFYLRDLLKIRQETLDRLVQIQANILKQYDINPKMNGSTGTPSAIKEWDDVK
jgi:hypothetical protein